MAWRATRVLTRSSEMPRRADVACSTSGSSVRTTAPHTGSISTPESLPDPPQDIFATKQQPERAGWDRTKRLHRVPLPSHARYQRDDRTGRPGGRRVMLSGLEGKTALITGASRGIGRAIA